ncbi:MAG TPA: DUF3810 domain-containing protein [Ferruginibacter sp.]|nr:DUF3810 domain-containing protein [Ferruginibacter sp.]HMP22052.1 DUF3810 domain-containing protein [Ferruginibacter sp.]
MRYRKQAEFTAIFILPAVLVHGVSRLPRPVIEKYYSTGIYPYISLVLKKCFGWLPISIGDLLYGCFGVWLLLRLIALARKFLKGEPRAAFLKNAVFRLLKIVLLLYTCFNLLWGLNYNRAGIAAQLQLSSGAVNEANLAHMDSLLLQKVNENRRALPGGAIQGITKRALFTAAVAAYDTVAKQYPFLQYRGGTSVKASLWGWLGNYVGFTGYYNPFTGEAQVNTSVPQFFQPFTTCHEIAHQLGYAKENEANFVAYLVAAQSGDTLLRYSAYLELFLYTNHTHYLQDSVSAKMLARQLDTAVKSDLEEWAKFSGRYKNPAAPVIRWLYGKYLEGNQQPEGVQSYDRATSLLIAYYKKFGKI